MNALQSSHATHWWQQSRRKSVGGALPALSPVSSAGLGQLFDATWESPTAAGLKELKVRCVAFVQRLRADGQTPERVLVALKREITGTGALHQAPSLCVGELDECDSRRAHMYERLFRWYLDAYFDP